VPASAADIEGAKALIGGHQRILEEIGIEFFGPGEILHAEAGFENPKR